MQYRIILFIFLVASNLHVATAQNAHRFARYQGIVQPETGLKFFEGEGNNIFVKFFKEATDEKGLQKIKRKLSIKEATTHVDSALQLTVLTTTEKGNGTTNYSTYYLVEREDLTTVVGFSRLQPRTVESEHFFMQAFINNTIPDSVYTPMAVNTIDFAGRTIKLGPACQWMSPHNIQCPPHGQMSWSMFGTLQEAEAYRDSYVAMTKSKNIADVLEEKWIPVLFEGQETKALRTKVKIQIPKMVMGGSNVLVGYYVVAEVRGHYIACVMSHYTDQAAPDTLPRLLAEVMALK